MPSNVDPKYYIKFRVNINNLRVTILTKNKNDNL